MMTITQAYTLLCERWPRRSFTIDVEVWHHDHTDSGSPSVMTVEWSIWDEEHRCHYRGGTLDKALDSAIGRQDTLDEVDSRVGSLKDESGPLGYGPPAKETP